MTEQLEILRHSTAHLMAQAIKRVFPQEKIELGVGPITTHGYFYDLHMERKILPEDFSRIEETMRAIIKEKLPVTRQEMNKNEALKFYQNAKEPLKVELIQGFPDHESISFYTQGEFTDLCRGPHVKNTSELSPHFKITQVAGAYWKGDEKREVLQRVYAVCFPSKKELDDHLHFLEEASRRDHRKLGKELELFLFDPVAPGSPFFLPKGAHVYNELVQFMRRLYTRFGYQEVITPQILDSKLWHTSGHYAHYKENMFFTSIDNREFASKPMNCPCHMLMYSHFKYSYRDLPLRFADFGRLHRYERSGTLAGLTRVRTFCQDDAHIFLSLKQIEDEIKKLLEMFMVCYEHFGFKEVKINLSTRPLKKEDRAGDDAMWDQAENALKNVLEKNGYKYELKVGDGSFYGPKIDIDIADALGRYYQLGTVQLDFFLPQRFELHFTNDEGKEEQPVVIHRALLGSLERFIGVYIEHVAGAFPFWLAPTQVVIVPVKNEMHVKGCEDLAAQLTEQGFRVRVDARNESMGLKTRQTQQEKVPFMLVMGDREIESKSVSLRKYGEKTSETKTYAELFQLFSSLAEEKNPKAFR